MDVKVNILKYNPETDRKAHWEEYNLEAGTKDMDNVFRDLINF